MLLQLLASLGSHPQPVAATRLLQARHSLSKDPFPSVVRRRLRWSPCLIAFHVRSRGGQSFFFLLETVLRPLLVALVEYPLPSNEIPLKERV